MALERIGLGAVMTFDGSQAARAMKAPRDATGRFLKTAQRVPPAMSRFGMAVKRAFTKAKEAARKLGQAAGQMGAAMRGAGMAGLPMTIALGAGIAKAASFEKQMDAVGAITRSSAEDMGRLEVKAKQMGATTVFSATQSGEAMEFMARAGFNTDEIITGLSGVMNAAAADGMDLASAANIVSNTMKGMGLEATDAATGMSNATRVADVLALTSAKTNTDMTMLGEGFKFAGAQAKTLGVPLEETSAALGVISDSGIKGTLAGTSFTNMLVKLSRPTSKAKKMMKDLHIELVKNDDGTLNLTDSIRAFNNGLKTIPDRVTRAATASELFGIRGQKAFAAMGTALDTIIPATGKSKLDTLNEQLKKASGAAAEMAKRRLDNFAGQVTLMKSAMEGFAIETAGQFLGPLADGTKNFTEKLGGVVQVLQLLNGEVFDNEDAVEKFGQTTVDVAKGIQDGVEGFIAVWKKAKATISSVIEQFTGKLGPGATRSMTKIITMTFIVIAAIAPILLAVGMIAFFVTSVLIPGLMAIGTAFMAIGGLISTVFLSPIMIVVAAALVIWYFFRDEILAGFNTFMEAAGPAFDFIRDKVMEFVTFAVDGIKELWQGFSQAMAFMKPLASVVFKAIGWIAGKVFQGIALVIGGLVDVAKPVFTVFKNIAKFLIEDIANGIVSVVKSIIWLADAINFDVPNELREFADQGTFRITTDKPPVVDVEGGPADAAKDAAKERANLAKGVTDQAAAQKQAAATPPTVQANIDLTDKRKLDINNKMCVDGREMSVASARHKTEVSERSGFKAKRWQQRFMLEQGAAPAGGG